MHLRVVGIGGDMVPETVKNKEAATGGGSMWSAGRMCQEGGERMRKKKVKLGVGGRGIHGSQTDWGSEGG